jgi:hypothetical protein
MVESLDDCLPKTADEPSLLCNRIGCSAFAGASDHLKHHRPTGSSQRHRRKVRGAQRSHQSQTHGVDRCNSPSVGRGPDSRMLGESVTFVSSRDMLWYTSLKSAPV